MTDEEWKSINEIYKKEFPDDMSFDKVSAKLDTMNNHPYIQELRSIFCNALVFVLTEGFVKYDDNSLVAYDGSLLKLVYENIEKLDKDRSFYWAFYYYLKKQLSPTVKHLLTNGVHIFLPMHHSWLMTRLRA